MGVSPWKVGLLFSPYETETDIGVFFAWIAGGRAVFSSAICSFGVSRAAHADERTDGGKRVRTVVPRVGHKRGRI